MQETEGGNQNFQKVKHNHIQDDLEPKIQERNEVKPPTYNLCTSFNCLGPRMLKVWEKRDGGRATSGSWNLAGKRHGVSTTLGSWGPPGITGGKRCN